MKLDQLDVAWLIDFFDNEQYYALDAEDCSFFSRVLKERTDLLERVEELERDKDQLVEALTNLLNTFLDITADIEASMDDPPDYADMLEAQEALKALLDTYRDT